MVYYNFKKHKEFFYLDLIVYLIPISIILGNLIINILSVICFFIYITLIFKGKIFYKNYKNYFNVFYALMIFFLINLVLSSNFQMSLVSLLGFVRYYFLFLAILFCLNEIKDFKNIFSKIIFILVLFVTIDVSIQHIFSIDLFGNEIIGSHGRRLSGPFGDEGVAGSFISKLFFLSCIYLYSNNIGKKLLFSIIIISIFVVILTNERSASIMFFTAALIFFIFCNLKIWKKFILLLLTVLSLATLINTNSNLKSHFVDIPLKYFKDNHHKAHYLTSYEIFKENKIFGSGIKTFRYLCGDEKYENIKTKYASYRCATHPHNIYLEILSETGIFGMFIFITINLYILISLIVNFFKDKSLSQEILFLFCSFFILFWPLQTTGSFFSTWNGIFYWIFFSYFFNLKKKSTI